MLPVMLLAVQNSEDQRFITEVFNRFQRLMYKIAGEYSSTSEDREEIFQIAVLRLVNSADALHRLNESKLPSYIATLTKNTALNYLKHKEVVLKHFAPIEEEDISADPFSVSPEDYILRREKWQQLLDAISTLSPSDQLVLGGKLILELPDEEMAQILGCKPQSVSMKLTRARRRAIREIKRIEQDDGS